MTRRRANTLIELLVAASLLLAVSLVTALLYRNTLATIQFTTSRSDSKQILRQSLSRLAPLLQTAYIPSLPGATTCYEKPLAPYPSGVNATDPLAPTGQGSNSFLFYSPVDLLDVNAVLLPVAHQQTHLFEIRLQEALEPDLSATGGPALTLRTLILQERIVPASFGLPPFPLIAGHSRELARHLSDLRLTRLSTIGLQVRLQAQGRQKTLGTQGQTIINNRLDSKIFFPVLSN